MTSDKAYLVEGKCFLDFIANGSIVVEFNVHLFPVLQINVRTQFL